MAIQHIPTGPAIDNILDNFEALKVAHAALQKKYANLQKRVLKRQPKTAKKKAKVTRKQDDKK